MLIFKKLENAINSINSNLALYEHDSEQIKLQENKLAALKEIVLYVKTYEWVAHAKSREKIYSFLKNNYNYKRTCEELGISLRSLEQSVSYASKTLQKKIGKNTIDLILNGEIEVAMLQFRLGTNTLGISNLFIKDIMSLLPEPKLDNLLTLDECIKELIFIKKLTMQHVQKAINFKDENKLAFILYLLMSNDTKYTYEKNLVYKYITDTINDGEILLEISKKKNIFL